MTDWAFSEPTYEAVITVRQIVQGGEPVLLVSHDADDGGWQFLTAGQFEVADGMVVSLESMVQRDPSLTELADLPAGWQATRAAIGQAWERGPSRAESDSP